MGVKNFIRRMAVKVAMQRPAPSRIPLSGYERLRLRNYTTCNLLPLGREETFLALEAQASGLKGLWFPGPTNISEEREIKYEDLSDYNLEITYYFRELELVYRSGLKFLLHRLLYIPVLQLWSERLARWLFNRKALTRSDSVKVLRIMIEKTLNDRDFGGGESTVMTELYGRRWVQHPELEKVHAYYSIVLDALVDNGDLVKEGHLYRLAPAGLTRIEKFDQEDEKFRLEHTHSSAGCFGLLWYSL